MSEGGSALSDILNPGRPLTWEEWDAGQFLEGPYAGQSIPHGWSGPVAANGTVMTMEYRGTGGTGGGGQTFDGGESVQGGIGTTGGGNTTPPPPNPLSGPGANGLPWYPNTYGLGPGMYASLQDQMAANQARQYRNPFAQTFERFQFSRGTPADQTTWKGWGKAAPNENYPLPNPTPPVPVTPPQQPPPATPPGPVVPPPAGQADMNRGPVGIIPPLRGDQPPVGQLPAMRGSPNNPGGLLGVTPPVSAAPVRGSPIGQQPSMRGSPNAPGGLLGGQMVGSQADATVASGRGLLGDKAAPAAPSAAPAVQAPWLGGGMAPSAGGAADAFRFSGSSPAETNYNALAQISPALAGKYYAAAAGSQPGLSTAALNQTGGGEAYHGLQNFYGSGGGMGYSGGRVLEAGGPSYLTATLANLSPSQRAAATAALKAQGLLSDTAQFQTMLTPQQAAAWGLTAAKLPPGMNPAGTGGMGLYTVPLAK